MNKVLLLGASGLLGQAVNAAFDYVSPKSSELDVTNIDQLNSFVSELRPSLVINCTGYNAVDDAELPENRESVFMLNETGPENLARLSTEYDYKLVQFSSDYVFNGENLDGYLEDAEVGPINVYGESKLAGERAVMDNSSKYFIVRISWLFGPGKRNFVTTMLDLSESNSELNVVNDQFGKPTYTVDVANALPLFTDTNDYGIYHLPNEDSVSWFDFARDVFTAADKDVTVKPVSSDEFKRLAKRPKSSILVNSKLPKQRSYREALNDYINNYI